MLVPETILQNRYRIIRQLGQGGMGAVYEAMDDRLDTIVALKETLFTDERLRKQFEREARLLARMHHPALPRVSDHFSEGDGQFLVMQFIAGEDLFEMMARKKGPFPADQVLSWGDQLLDALDYLHTQDPQIIHRDIKPQNLKLTARGQIILLDFGLAKGQAGEISRADGTSASIFGYTPNYAPLEQIQGLGTDARSDIYALSATLYHLMTGVKPPDALTRAAAIVNGQPDPLQPGNEVNSGIDQHVAAVLAKAMSQNREQRYSTAAAMRTALKSTPQVSTIAEREGAATVIRQSSAATRADQVATQLKPTVAKSGETTVVQERPRRNLRLAPWAVAGMALILAGVAFGSYYVIKNRGEEAAALSSPTPVASSTPAPELVQNVDPNATPAEEGTTKPEADKVQRVENAANVKKGDKTTKRTEPGEKDFAFDSNPAPTPPATGDKYNPFPNPSPSLLDPPNPGTVDPLRGRRFRRLTGSSVRNLPDGTQIITNPDGTRVVTFPNGTKRIFRPGERIRRVP